MISKTKLKQLPLSGKLFLIIVVIPTIISVFYYIFIASDIYISEAKYALRVSADSPSVGLVESFMSGTSGIEFSSEDANIVMDFIHSRDMIHELDEVFAIRSHFESKDIDFISRFNSDDTLEDFLEYYRDKVEINTDSATHISTLRVKAFEPNTAYSIAKKIIELSETLVNNLSNRVVEDSLQFARSEVKIAEKRVRDSSKALTQFRNENQSINPGEETSAVLNIITGLESQLAESRTNLLEALSFMQEGSTQVQVLKVRVNALEKQVAEERKRLTNNDAYGRDYTRLIDHYEPIILEHELARQQYASTLASLELARIDAQRQQRYLLPFIPPQIPDKAVEPNRTKSIITIFIGLCLLYALGYLIWATIKDHMRL